MSNDLNLYLLSCRLEFESGSFFDMKFFEGLVLSGSWDRAENYLSGFTKFDDNRYSRKIYLELRKQKFLEALDRWVSYYLFFLHF